MRRPNKTGFRGVRFIADRPHNQYYVSNHFYVGRYSTGEEAELFAEAASHILREMKSEIRTRIRSRVNSFKDYSYVGDWSPADELPEPDELPAPKGHAIINGKPIRFFR